MIDSKILSINIPSNNKTLLLKESFFSINDEINKFNECEICISDNSNTDETEHAFNRLKKKYKFQYRRSLDSLSLDENINTVINMSKSKYSWIFADDDLIIPGSVNKILKILKEIKPDILIVNSQTFFNDKIIEKRRHFLKNNVKYDRSENDEFLKDMVGYLTYAPSIIINNEVWKNYFKKEFIGTFFAHIYVVLNAKISNKAFFLADPCIKMRLHSQTWTSKHFEIWYIFYSKVVWNNDKYSDKAKMKVIKKNRLNSFFVTPAARAYGRYNLKTYKVIILKSNSCNLFFKFYHLIIALLPTFIFSFIYRLLIKFFFKKSIDFSPNIALELLK